MSIKLIKSALCTAVTLAIAACGGSGSSLGVAGIGGSGYIASGSVTGFGSVFVNGVEFETSGTMFDIDGSGSGMQNDLAIGMVVTVNGTINADGVTGTATSIIFDDQLQGPVSRITAVTADPDGENRSFTIFGQKVLINLINTVFDISSTCIACTPFDFASIDNQNNVEVSGFFNAAGELVATRIELKATSFQAGSDIVEIKGTVSNYTDTSTPFSLIGFSAVAIDASAANLVDLPNSSLTNDILVEVKGTCSNTVCSTLNAARIEGQSGFSDADKISVEGLITNFDAPNKTFKINGVNVDASSATLSPSTLVLDNGQRVEAEGPISNNIIQAIKVDQRGGSARVHAAVASVEESIVLSHTGSFVVSFNGASNTTQAITVTVTTETKLEGTIAKDHFVRIRGFENETGGITATQVEDRGTTPDDVIVQGGFQMYDKNTATVKLLSVSFNVDNGQVNPETEFQDINDNTSDDSILTTATPGTLVKVKDKEGGGASLNGIADEVELETD